VIPQRIRNALLQSGRLSHLKQSVEKDPEYRHAAAAKKKAGRKR